MSAPVCGGQTSSGLEWCHPSTCCEIGTLTGLELTNEAIVDVHMDPLGSTCLQHLGFTILAIKPNNFNVASGTEIAVIVLVRQILH